MDESNQANMPSAGAPSAKKYIAVVVVLLLLVAGFYMFGGSKKGVNNPIPEANRSPIEIKIDRKDAPADWKSYKVDDFGAEVKYPPAIFTEEKGEADVPTMNTKIVGTRLVHTVNVPYCADPKNQLSCKPTSEDIAIGVFFMKKNFVDFRDMLIKQTPDAKLQGVTFDGRQGFMLGADVDGKGIFQYFIPILNGDGVAIITRAYINEEVATLYKSAKGFIPFEQQKEIFTGVVQGLKLE